MKRRSTGRSTWSGTADYSHTDPGSNAQFPAHFFLPKPGSYPLSHMATLWINAMSNVITRPIHGYLFFPFNKGGGYFYALTPGVFFLERKEISTHLKLGLVLPILRKG